MPNPSSRRLPGVTTAFLSAASILIAGCDGGPTVLEDVDVEVRSVVTSGDSRTFRLYHPPTLGRSGAAPLVLVYHGATQSAAGIEQMSWMYPAARDGRVRVAYLEATGDYWSTPASPPIYWPVNDMGYTEAVLDALVAEGLVDPTRVYATGFSNGAIFVERLACSLQDRIAAVAVVGASMSRDLAASCRLHRPVPALFFLGDADNQFFWDDGFAANFFQYGGQGSADWWADEAGCDPQPEVTQVPDTVDDGTTTEVWSYSGCRNGGDFRFYRIRGGGHTWPGSPLGGGGVLGPQSLELDASREMVEFFLEYRRPEAG